MIYKKTFWMNVLFAIAWVLFCLLMSADIEYVEHTLTRKILTFLTMFFIFATLIVTAVHLCKSNTPLLRKLVIFANRFNIMLTIGYLIVIVFYRPSVLSSIDFLIALFVYGLFITPFAINLKAVKAS